MTTATIVADTIGEATPAARAAMATYKISPLTSMTTAVRVALPGNRIARWDCGRDAFIEQGGDWGVLPLDTPTNPLARNYHGEPIVLGSSGPCWMAK